MYLITDVLAKGVIVRAARRVLKRYVVGYQYDLIGIAWTPECIQVGVIRQGIVRYERSLPVA